jgi:hypothetical protein
LTVTSAIAAALALALAVVAAAVLRPAREDRVDIGVGELCPC